jgi:hypothetical protein
MRLKSLNLPTCLYLLSVIILVAGLSSAMLIYRAAENDFNSDLGYRDEGGSVYPIMPGDSKKYLRDMELYGGKANVMADELRRWLVGLWQGKSLAYTVACVATVISFGVYYVASRLPSHLRSDRTGQNNRDTVTRR